MQNLLADWKTYGEGQDGQALVVLAYNRDEEAVKHLLKEHDFSEAVLPKRSGTASQVQQELLQEAKEREEKITRLQQETRDTLPQKQQVELYYDQLSAAHDRLQNGGVETVSAFKVQGWVRKDRTQRVEKSSKALRKRTSLPLLTRQKARFRLRYWKTASWWNLTKA